MTVAAWQALHAYTAGDIVNPTTANGHSYRCATAGTSGATEPTWVGRYQDITDGTAHWVVYTVITPSQVRAQLNLEGTTGQYSDDTIGGYILDAIGSLEQATRRKLCNAPGYTYTLTSMGRASLDIPGFRTFTSVQYQGADFTSGGGYWALPDAMNTGVFTGMQFRSYRQGDGPWWLSNPHWFDQNWDSPFFPANYGGGYVFSSMPNDTVIVGDAGYEPLFEPGNVVHAIEVLSEWYVMRPPALLADQIITPAGGVVSYASMPPEVQEFVRTFSTGQMVVSVGS